MVGHIAVVNPPDESFVVKTIAGPGYLRVMEQSSRHAACFVVDLTKFGAAHRAAPMGWLLECDCRAADIRGRIRGASPPGAVEAGRVGALIDRWLVVFRAAGASATRPLGRPEPGLSPKMRHSPNGRTLATPTLAASTNGPQETR